MRRGVSFGLTIVALLGGCKTVPFEGPPDLRPGPDLAGADLSQPPDLAPCVAVDAGAGECPCGKEGLCRPATGRLSVQVQTFSGSLKLVVMDDNGCNRHDVASDQPIGVPRWAPDGQRLGYITANQTSVLHVIGVAPSGKVTCGKTASLGSLKATELAWAGEHELWLLQPAPTMNGGGALARWRLGKGVEQMNDTGFRAFDALRAPGPVVGVATVCLSLTCVDMAFLLPSVPGMGMEIASDKAKIGQVRLRAAGDAVVFSSNGYHFVPVQGGPDQPLGMVGDRSPAFALDGWAVVYTTDDGRLRYHSLNQQFEEQTIPATWRNVFSPDWTPMPASCDPLPECD